MTALIAITVWLTGTIIAIYPLTRHLNKHDEHTRRMDNEDYAINLTIATLGALLWPLVAGGLAAWSISARIWTGRFSAPLPKNEQREQPS